MIAKSEIRISKSETISKFKEEIVQTKLPGRRSLVLNFLFSFIRICFGFRISDFGFGPLSAQNPRCPALRDHRASSQSAFTMVEIALCIAIIGFALVAIIGVLPTAMRVQQDNRSDTIIDQDGTYLMEAIRHRAQGLDDLINYVKRTPSSVRIVTNSSSGFVTNFLAANDYDTSRKLIALLSTPRTNNDDFRVEAEFRAISGAAVEKYPNSEMNFEYLLVAEVVPFSAFDAPTAFPTVDPNAITRTARNLQNNLYELRLTLRWPLSVRNPDGPAVVGDNSKVFRTLVNGSLASEPDRAFVQKQESLRRML